MTTPSPTRTSVFFPRSRVDGVAPDNGGLNPAPANARGHLSKTSENSR